MVEEHNFNSLGVCTKCGCGQSAAQKPCARQPLDDMGDPPRWTWWPTSKGAGYLLCVFMALGCANVVRLWGQGNIGTRIGTTMGAILGGILAGYLVGYFVLAIASLNRN